MDLSQCILLTMELVVSEIIIYPIKSLGGIALQEAKVEAKGLQYDRRWMLIDPEGHQMTQRKFKTMALLQPEIREGLMHITHKQKPELSFSFSLDEFLPETLEAHTWETTCEAQEVSKAASAWFSEVLGMPCQLVRMPEAYVRPTDPDFSATENDRVSFADGFPILIFDEASVALISEKAGEDIPANRFRANIITKGGHAHVEDELKRFSIGELDFFGAKPCTRCVLTTIDQATAQAGAEPLKTLATYRKTGNKIKFGLNVIPLREGIIRVGDALTIKETEEPIAF